jgi:hypothetical protein
MSAKPVPLKDGNTVGVDTVDKHEWQLIIDRFSDANIYQTWSYDAIRCGESNISHLVVLSSNEIIAAAQVRIVRLPILGLGAAYVRWGPFWQLRDKNPEIDVFRLALRALRNEYVCRRGLILRIFPILYDNESQMCSDVLTQEGYKPVTGENPGRTLIMDISRPNNVIRQNLDQKWRNCLNKAEKNELEIIEGTDDELFAEFIKLYRVLLDRKKFREPNDINEFRRIQRDLLPQSKMRIFLCRSEGEYSAGVICATIGDTGVYLFGATNDLGMTNKGSYLLQWRAIQWMKDNGCRNYNLNGINPEKNPGSYHFKSGLSGKNGKDLCYLGRFDCYSGVGSALLALTADSVFPYVRKTISISRLRSKSGAIEG